GTTTSPSGRAAPDLDWYRIGTRSLARPKPVRRREYIRQCSDRQTILIRYPAAMAEVARFAAIGARDQSVLLAIAQWELIDNSPGRFLELPELQRRLGVQLPDQVLTACVGRLVRAGYVEAAELTGAGIEEYTIKR